MTLKTWNRIQHLASDIVHRAWTEMRFTPPYSVTLRRPGSDFPIHSAEFDFLPASPKSKSGSDESFGQSYSIHPETDVRERGEIIVTLEAARRCKLSDSKLLQHILDKKAVVWVTLHGYIAYGIFDPSGRHVTIQSRSGADRDALAALISKHKALVVHGAANLAWVDPVCNERTGTAHYRDYEEQKELNPFECASCRGTSTEDERALICLWGVDAPAAPGFPKEPTCVEVVGISTPGLHDDSVCRAYHGQLVFPLEGNV